MTNQISLKFHKNDALYSPMKEFENENILSFQVFEELVGI
jgi:hypothetical protein